LGYRSRTEKNSARSIFVSACLELGQWLDAAAVSSVSTREFCAASCNPASRYAIDEF